MVCVVCCKCSQKKEVFLIWVVDLVRAVETGGRGGGTRVDVVVVLGLILKCFVGGLIDEGVEMASLVEVWRSSDFIGT